VIQITFSQNLENSLGVIQALEESLGSRNGLKMCLTKKLNAYFNLFALPHRVLHVQQEGVQTLTS